MEVVFSVLLVCLQDYEKKTTVLIFIASENQHHPRENRITVACTHYIDFFLIFVNIAR